MVRLRRDPAGRDGNSSRRCVLWIAACLMMGRIGFGQISPPDGTYASPSVSSPNSVLGGPPPAFGPLAQSQDTGMLPINGSQEPGALQNLSFNQSLGNLGTVNLYGSPNAGSYGGGGSFTLNPGTNASSLLYFRDLQAGVYTNTQQTVVNAGSTFSLFSNKYFGIGGRALMGATIDDNLHDNFHFAGDAFAGVRLPGEIWLKGGLLYDRQNNFYKIGPTFGAVFLADARHPITLDMAYGIGHGANKVNVQRTGTIAIANDDVQLRIGSYVSPMWQVGMSGNWQRWDDPRFRDGSGIGGFTRINIADLQITVDVTNGNLGTRGFVNVAYVFGGPQRRCWRDSQTRPFVDCPEDWLTRPVIRDVSLQLQTIAGVPTPGTGSNGAGGGKGSGGTSPSPTPLPTTPLVGNVTQILFSIQFDPSQDQVNPGVLDPGDGFNMIVQFGNGTSQTVSNVSTTNLSATAPFVVFNSSTSAVISSGSLPPGTVVSNVIATSNMGIDPTATQGSQFFLDFDVTADGQTRRFRSGPISLGTTGNSTPAMTAIPLN